MTKNCVKVVKKDVTDCQNNNILSVSNIFFNNFHTVFRYISKLVKHEQILF